MREIKFRAWYSGDIEKGEPLLFEQKEIDHELFFVCKEAPEIMYPFYIPFIDTDWIVEQYTGLKDNNGVEIYDGDVVVDDNYSSSYGKGVVYWDEEEASYQIEYEQKTNYSRELLVRIAENDIEIIGNIHDKEKIK